MSLDDGDSLDSLTLPPPPFSTLADFYRDFCEDSNEKVTQPKKDKSEIDFDNISFYNINKNDEKMDFVDAFNRLYEEYIDMCEKYGVGPNLKLFSSGDNHITDMENFEKIRHKLMRKEFSTQTEQFLTFANSMDSLQTITSMNSSFFKNIKHFFQPAFDIGSCIKIDSVKKNYNLILCDTIINENINVFEVKEKSNKIISHQIIVQNYNKNNKKFLKLPIALELLLPKMQRKIDIILTLCPFLCDPLEVMSELRHYNYDDQKCIKYFQKTKHLRYLYDQEKMEHLNHISINTLKEITSNKIQEKTIEVIKYKNVSFCSINQFSQIDTNYVPVFDVQSLEKVMCDVMVQTEDKKENLKRLSKNIKNLKESQYEISRDVKYLANQLSKVFCSLKNHLMIVINQCSERLINNEQKLRMMTFSRQVEELKIKLKEEEKKRRQVYNRMQEQMGNVRVYCRCRNLSDDENVLEYLGEDSLILTTVSNERFEFDKVFTPGITQGELFEEFRPLVMSFIDGYNVCFITYGGEASGKTYTLIGDNRDNSHQGIMQRSLFTILTEEKLRQRDWEYKISACVVEIYNDNCTDILSGESGIQIYVDNGMETAYQKLKSVPITNEADADVLIQVCTVKRKVARTALNPASSRSHLIILIRLQGCSKIHGENICSFLCLSDLAGFEDIIKAETQTNKILSKEAGYINRSLTAFNRVFVSLKKQDPNTVSYRDTKLTHLLKPFLTNSGKCALIVTVRNDRRSVGSTHNTLRFGKETRGVSLGKARRQVNLNNHPSGM